MKITKKIITKLLMDNPSNRDSDNKLIANFWWKELYNNKININDLSAFDFLHMLSENKFTSSETIRRTRAKVQEEHKELRGKLYNKRQIELQNKVKKELGYETY